MFSSKSLREFNNFHARYRVVQNLDLYDWHYSCSLLTTADLFTQEHAHLSLCFRISLLRKCFASLHFTDNAMDLVSSVAVGLTVKDFLTMFHLVCHVLSINRSCQMKCLKSKTEQLVSSKCISHRPSRMQTYIWLDVHYGNFLASLSPPES